MTRADRGRVVERKIVESLMAGQGIKQIARSLSVSRRRVRELRAKAVQLGYLAAGGGKGGVALPAYPEAVFAPPEQASSSRPSAAEELLAPHEGWMRERLLSGWHSVTLFEELPVSGVSRSSFYRYLERHKLNRLGERARRRVVPEIVHRPGEALLLDWGKLRDVIDPATGRKRTLWMLAGVLGYSRLLLVRLVWTIDVATTLWALQDMFRELGGVTGKITTDNPKCIALEASKYEALLNPAAERFAAHYGVLLEALPPADPQKKGKIERPIPYLRRLYEAHGDAWQGLEESQAYLERKLAIANLRKHGTTMRKPQEVFEAQERAALRELPAVAYELEEYHEGVVRRDGHVRFANKYYSVDEDHIGKEVSVLGNSRQVAIYLKGRLLELHPRVTDPAVSKSTKPHHRKPWEREMENGSMYRQRARKIGASVEELIVRLLEKGDGFVDTRKIWGILSLEKTYPAARVEAACRKALDLGSLSWRTVKAFLEAGEAAAVADAPPAPRRAPQAHRYVRPLSVYQEQLSLLSLEPKEGHA